MNVVHLKGTLTRDPSLVSTDGGWPILNMTLAVNGVRYNPDTKISEVTTMFVAVQSFGSLAIETAEASYTKGDELMVIGELTQTEVVVGDKKDRKTRVAANMVTPTRRRYKGTDADDAGF